jgi:phosphoenolpyruvate synthase/pyruvate phosphate dikinase
MNVGQYRQLTKGSSLEKYEDDEDITDSTAGLQRLLKRPKELELAIKIIKRVRNVHGHRNASIAVEYAGTPENVIEFKKSVSANGLRRSSTFKIYLMVDTPSIALIVDQYEDTGIDGMIIDIKSLKKLMMAPDYDSASILKIMDEIKDNLKDGICIVRFPGKSKKIMDKVVERGFHGIAVTRKNMEYARKNIIKLERKALL